MNLKAVIKQDSMVVAWKHTKCFTKMIKSIL